MFAAEIKRKRSSALRQHRQWRWHLDGSPATTIVTDGLRSYGAVMKEIGAADRQQVGRWLNNRAENSHQPFR